MTNLRFSSARWIEFIKGQEHKSLIFVVQLNAYITYR